MDKMAEDISPELDRYSSYYFARYIHFEG